MPILVAVLTENCWIRMEAGRLNLPNYDSCERWSWGFLCLCPPLIGIKVTHVGRSKQHWLLLTVECDLSHLDSFICVWLAGELLSIDDSVYTSSTSITMTLTRSQFFFCTLVTNRLLYAHDKFHIQANQSLKIVFQREWNLIFSKNNGLGIAYNNSAIW